MGGDERRLEKQPIQVNHTTEYRERGRGNMLLPRFLGGEDVAKARPAEGELGSMTRSVAEMKIINLRFRRRYRRSWNGSVYMI